MAEYDNTDNGGFEGFDIPVPPPFEEGETYAATLTGLRKVDFEDKETHEPRSLISWGFVIETGGETYDIEGTSSTATGPKSKAYGWLVALVGAAAVKGGARFQPDALIGREAMVTIGMDKNDYPKVASVAAMPRS